MLYFFFKIIKEYKIIFLIVNEEEQSKGKNILKKFKKIIKLKQSNNFIFLFILKKNLCKKT